MTITTSEPNGHPITSLFTNQMRKGLVVIKDLMTLIINGTRQLMRSAGDDQIKSFCTFQLELA